MSLTVTNGTGDAPFLQSYGGVLNSSNNELAADLVESFTAGEQVSWSVDYMAVDGDDADGAYVYVIAIEGYTIDAVNFSCTPALKNR